MRWIAALAILIMTSFVISWGSTEDLQDSSEATLDALVLRSAAAEEFKQRHQTFGIECTACHGAELDFSVVPPMEQCLACHESYDAVAKLTADVVPNPHHSHMGEVPCSDCHSEHQEFQLSCNQCHIFEMDFPD